MLTAGVKASHDGGVALIDGDRLVFSVEVEKLDNGPRYAKLRDLDQVSEILRGQGVDPKDVDRFVVDGWWPERNAEHPGVATGRGGEPFFIPLAPYADGAANTDPLHRYTFSSHHFNSRRTGYSSYHHVSGHALAAYCTSPFAQNGEEALVLVWDGGTSPRLYQVAPGPRTLVPLGPLFPMTGDIFTTFSSKFDPFRRMPGASGTEAEHLLAVAGKAMAYAALGSVSSSARPHFDRLFAGFAKIPEFAESPPAKLLAADREPLIPGLANADLVAAFQSSLGEQLLDRLTGTHRDALFPGLTNADLIASFQDHLGVLLIERLTEVVRTRFPGQSPALCIGGGCALNIKWNSAIRRSGLFRDVWVPPFPNDAGAAIGTAACELFRTGGSPALDWNVYSGPGVFEGTLPEGWTVRPCDESGLAELLHTEGEPVVVLSGRAELGPRALGNRSILAPAVDPGMKKRLNDMKQRAHYRPVAPLCLTHRASEVFDPGTPDRFMLFDHRMRPGWAERVPAVVHLDGSARLQTIDASADVAAARILVAYERISGIPVLCNTSANLNGSGFFPDVASAARWGGARYIWSDGRLYTHSR